MQGVDQIRTPGSSTLHFYHPAVPASAGGPNLYIRSGASAIKWAYTLNTQSIPTIGGEIVQVLSAFVGPMEIGGQTAGMLTNASGVLEAGQIKGWKSTKANKNNYSPNDELKAIVDWFEAYMEVAGATTRDMNERNERAIKFTYAARGWSFYIMPTALTGFKYDATVISPEWGIQAEVVNDNALDFFAGVTMSSFNDDVLSNQILIGKLGISNFANSGTETANPAFGQTGDTSSTDPFLNPELGPGAGALAQKMGDNFQALVAAWSTGTFTDFGFGALEDNTGALPKSVNDLYQQYFGTSYLGRLPGNAGTGTTNASGNQVYGGPANPTSKNQIALDISSQFESKGMPGRLGVAVSLVETGGSLNPDDRQPNGDFAMGLFQTFPLGAGGTYHKAALTLAINNKDQPVTKYYPVDAQISDAASWFKATSGSDSLTGASDQALAVFGQKAQGAGDPTYVQKVLVRLGDADTLLKAAQAANPTGGAASGVRLSVINWANKMVGYAKANGAPQYSEGGRRDMQNISPGDFAAVSNPGCDCSSTIALLYAWGTNNNTVYGLNGKSFNGVTTVTMWSTWAAQEIPKEAARAGDLVIYGSSPGSSVHVNMFMQDWSGDNTSLFQHGEGVPHFATWSGENGYFAANGHPAHVFRVLP